MAGQVENVFVCQMENSADYSLALALFSDVTNTVELRKLVISGKIEAALIKPSMIADPFQAIVAAHKSVHLFKLRKLKTKTIHSEIIFNLSPNNSITDSFHKFGTSDEDTSVLVVLLTTGDVLEKIQAIDQHIQGKQVPISHWSEFTDERVIKKVYKIQDCEMNIGSLSEAVICRMSTKDCL